MNCTWMTWRIGWIHPFLQIFMKQIASAAMNWIDTAPQATATTFSFSSVFILLLWWQHLTKWKSEKQECYEWLCLSGQRRHFRSFSEFEKRSSCMFSWLQHCLFSLRKATLYVTDGIREENDAINSHKHEWLIFFIGLHIHNIENLYCLL